MVRKLAAGVVKLTLQGGLGKELCPSLLKQDDIQLLTDPQLHKRGKAAPPRPLLGLVETPDIVGGQPEGPAGPRSPLLAARV